MLLVVVMHRVLLVLLLVLSALVVRGVAPRHLVQHASLHVEPLPGLLRVRHMGLLLMLLLTGARVEVTLRVALLYRGRSDRTVL